MRKEEPIEMNGIVKDVYPGTRYKVELLDEKGKGTGHEITATISGKLRINSIKIVKGDKVQVEMSPYDLTKGRISWRIK